MPDRVRQLHTTRSPSFLGLYTDDNNNNNNNVPGRLLSMSDSGSNNIIGVIDSSIWPEHLSFGDQGLGPIPSRWKGECVEGQKFTKSLCNKKIIGARFFYKGYEEAYGKINTSVEILSARDTNGHGTHTSSTAAGRAVANASLFGYAKGTAVGVAPKARIASYKVYIDHFSPNATGTIVFHDTMLGIKPAPIVASFSSRGPTYVSPFLMKPDLIAPGVNILAAYPSYLRRTEFNLMSGTSMSTPHISGVAALLKGAHTDWTPAMIRSAMMTSAYTKDKQGRGQILDSNDYTNATVWAMGAGHVDPEKAVDPGLVYDISPDDYFNFLCASKYSALTIKSVTRKRKGEKKSYSVRITVHRKLTVASGESPTTDVGEIVWSDEKRKVVSPVVMKWKKDY